jgi:hypothetical protein
VRDESAPHTLVRLGLHQIRRYGVEGRDAIRPHDDSWDDGGKDVGLLEAQVNY